jgi:hypothetical protein
MSRTTFLPDKRFLVDTNIILGYLLKQYPKIDKLIESPKYQFFYTETVQQELKTKGTLLKNMERTKRYFTFVDSGLTQLHKDTTLKFFHDSWIERFAGIKAKQRKFAGLDLSDEQFDDLKNDLRIIMEASSCRYNPIILPENDMRTPRFLTNNYHLFKKFIKYPETKALLESTIDMAGMEHLIPFTMLEEALEKLDD